MRPHSLQVQEISNFGDLLPAETLLPALFHHNSTATLRMPRKKVTPTQPELMHEEDGGLEAFELPKSVGASGD